MRCSASSDYIQPSWSFTMFNSTPVFSHLNLYALIYILFNRLMPSLTVAIGINHTLSLLLSCRISQVLIRNVILFNRLPCRCLLLQYAKITLLVCSCLVEYIYFKCSVNYFNPRHCPLCPFGTTLKTPSRTKKKKKIPAQPTNLGFGYVSRTIN